MIEQLASFRAIPHIDDEFVQPMANETAEAWRVLMPMKNQPVALVLTRQTVPTFDRSKYASAEGLAKGAYILADSGGTPDVILIGTGSEVQLCVGAYEQLTGERRESAKWSPCRAGSCLPVNPMITRPRSFRARCGRESQ